MLVMHVSSAPLTSLCWLTTFRPCICVFISLLPLSLHFTIISHHLYDTLEDSSNAITFYSTSVL
jgi:hypothetical protein